MKTLNLLLFFAIIASSCNVLSKGQVKNINAFAKAANNYVYFPSELILKRGELVLEEKLVMSIQLSPALIKENIKDAQKNNEKQQELAEEMDLSLQLIQQYSSLLTKLSSPVFVENLSDNTNHLNDNLGNLVKIANAKFGNKIPTNVGDVITKVIFLVGERLTKNKQAKALKEFVPIGDTLIKITVKNLIDGLDTVLHPILVLDREKFVNTYTNNILAKPEKVDYNSLNQYMIAMNNFDDLEVLRKKCITAAKKLSAAHTKLTISMRTKADISEIFAETQDLIESIQDLYKTYKKLSPAGKS